MNYRFLREAASQLPAVAEVLVVIDLRRHLVDCKTSGNFRKYCKCIDSSCGRAGWQLTAAEIGELQIPKGSSEPVAGPASASKGSIRSSSKTSTILKEEVGLAC